MFKLFDINKVSLTQSNLDEIITLLKELSIVGEITYVNLISYINNLKSENKTMYVVMLQEKIIGTGTVLFEKKIIHGLGLVGHLEDLVVSKDFRRLRVASMIIQKIKDDCLAAGCYKIILNAKDSMSQFYEKHGFSDTGRQYSIYL